MTAITRRAAGTVLVVVLATTSAACDRSPEERSGGLLVPWSSGQTEASGVVANSAVMVFGVPTFAVREPLVLDRAELLDAPPDLDVVAVRASFVGCPRCRRRPGYLGVTGTATSVCIGPHPPASFGPTYEVAGLEVAPGDAPSLLFYVRAGRAGRFAAAGYRVHYRTPSGARYAVESRHVTFALERVDAVDAGGDVCVRSADSIWTGGTGGGQQIVPLD